MKFWVQLEHDKYNSLTVVDAEDLEAALEKFWHDRPNRDSVDVLVWNIAPARYLIGPALGARVVRKDYDVPMSKPEAKP